MIIETKGDLIEEFANLSSELIKARKELETKSARLRMIEELISLDNELSEMVIAGGISTINNELVVLNKITNQLEIRKCAISYSIKSELTTDQLKVINNEK